jgi:predicted enzyme related to lactoylglutathione lyase
MSDASRSFYFFDVDDNLLFLPTSIYLWNAETQAEKVVNSGEFAAIQNKLGREAPWQSWSIGERTFRDFRDDPAVPVEQQTFIADLRRALAAGDDAWRGPAFPLLVHACDKGRPIAVVTARGHEPETIEAGFRVLVEVGLLPQVPVVIGFTTAAIKKRAIKHAVAKALDTYGADLPHRFGMSDDDPNNVVLAISAMRDCKAEHPDKRFFVINTNHEEYVKLEIFPMDHPVTAQPGTSLLGDAAGGPKAIDAGLSGGNASVYVTDIDRAVAFWTEVVGLPLKTRVGTEWAEIDAGRGLVVGLHRARPPETASAGQRGAINIEIAASRPLDQVVAEMQARGARFRGEIVKYEAVWLASLLDSDDNEILLAQVLEV